MSTKQIYKRFLANQLIAALKQRNFEALYCETQEQALEQALALLPAQATVSCGGSETLKELGLIERLRQGPYTFLDPHAAQGGAAKEAVARAALQADYYFMSANALTEAGELVNADGIGNRLAALLYGPQHVIVVVGLNKIRPDLESAIARVKTEAARLCLLQFKEDYPTFADLQQAAEQAVSHLVITSRAAWPGRIKIVLVGEDLGY